MRFHPRLVPRSQAGRRALGLSVSLGTAAGLALILQAWLLATVIARALLEGAGLAVVRPLLAGYLVAAAVRAGCAWVSEVEAAHAAAEVRRQLRSDLVSRLFALGPAYTTRERAGELAHTLTGGIESTDAYVSQFLPQAALALIVPALVATAVFLSDPLSSLVLVLTGPLIPLFMVLIGRAAAERTRRQWRVLSHASARFLDALQGLATLKVLQRAGDELRVIAETSERYRRVTIGVLKVAFLSALALEALATLSTAIVAVEVGLRVLYARMAFREAMFVLLLAPEFYRPLRALGASFHAAMAGTEAATRVGEVLDTPGPDSGNLVVASPSAGRTTSPMPGSPAPIVFDGVSARYDATRPWAVHDLRFEIRPRTTVAIVGASGAGKSTVLQLLLRFLEPTAGRLLVDGMPLQATAADDWRDGVAWVPQRPHLFAGSVRENLLLARPEASAGEVERALALSRADEFVRRLPRGLDTPIGETGARLSGGQAQRLALARALLKRAPYLLLDEPTSQLDPWNEREILAALSALRGEATLVLVTHRLTAAMAADDILILSRGRLLEQGSHGELLAAAGHYARMVAASGCVA
jgi:ATP-binding cassette subfamily C protein CydD